MTVLLPNNKLGRAKVTYYVGRERRPKGRVSASLECNDTVAWLQHTSVCRKLRFFTICYLLPVTLGVV
jgi:hypothetical protein